jgi:transposase InsO family protein
MPARETGAGTGAPSAWPHRKVCFSPYLLGSLSIERPNQVWASDITYIPIGRGFLYLSRSSIALARVPAASCDALLPTPRLRGRLSGVPAVAGALDRCRRLTPDARTRWLSLDTKELMALFLISPF